MDKNFYHEPTRTAYLRYAHELLVRHLVAVRVSSCGSWLKKSKKQIFLLFVIAVLTSGFHLHAQGLNVSGILDSSLQGTAGDAPQGFSLGMEEYANIRFQSKIRDNAAVYGAVNLLAATGNYAANAEKMAALGSGTLFNSTSYVYGENYIAGIELERLYFRLSGESVDFDGGLMRLPFGYSQVWGSSDFLNPRNPLILDARPRAILGTAFFWYPTEETKLLTFYSTPRDPLSQKGGGSFVGLSFDKHWNKASIQTLYSFETPQENSINGIHRAGLSVKVDLAVGFIIDALYTYNHEAQTRLDGLSFSGGADYSFFSGKLIFLAEYLYNGKNSSTAFNLETNLLGFPNTHYLYTSLTLRFTDYTNMSVALITGFDDTSFVPILTLNHDLFQGVTLTISAQKPEDRYFVVITKLRLRF